VKPGLMLHSISSILLIMIRIYCIFFLLVLFFFDLSAQSKTITIKDLIKEKLEIVSGEYKNGNGIFYGYGKADTIVSRMVRFGSKDALAIWGKSSF
jgi:hypothetical protein